MKLKCPFCHRRVEANKNRRLARHGHKLVDKGGSVQKSILKKRSHQQHCKGSGIHG